MDDRALGHLARELQSARTSAGRSLRDVAEAAEISAAYLQKLERAQVAKPSPKILQRLAATLGLEYRRLMEFAGYAPITTKALGTGLLERRLASAALTQTEERAIAAFVDHLIAQRSGDAAQG